MVTKSEARISAADTAVATTATATATAAPQKKRSVEEDEITGEVPPEVKSIVFVLPACLRRRLFKSSTTNSSQSTSTACGTCGASATRHLRTRNESASRMGCSGFGRHRERTRTSNGPSTRFGGKSSTTTKLVDFRHYMSQIKSSLGHSIHQ